jgi:hypothetical protein
MAPVADCRKFLVCQLWIIAMYLEFPPNLTLFRVIDLDSRFVKLAWTHQYLFKSAFKFHYELDWASQRMPYSSD